METEEGLDKLIDIICYYYKIDRTDVLKRTRKARYSNVRQVIHYFARKYTRHSLSYIGLHVGELHHSSVIYSVDTVKTMISIYPKVNRDIFNITELIKTNMVV